MNLDNEETDLEVVKKPNVIPGRNNVVKTLDRISKEDGIISLLLRGSQESLSNATKPNVTQSAENPEDLRSDQNSKPREAVKRQRAETTDPLTESKLKLTKTTPTVTGLDAPTNKNEVASVAGKKVEDLRIYLDYKKRMRANDHAAVPEVRTTSKFKQDEAVPSPSHSRQKTTSGSPSIGCWMRKDNRQSRSIRFNTSNQLL